MSRRSISVLKFGGSVLTDEHALENIVHHVYQEVREGHHVIAVVSAFKGETDSLFDIATGYAEQPDPACVAALAETGELRAAAHLGLALDAHGVSTQVLHAGTIQLQAQGDTLDAIPTSVNEKVLQTAFDDTSVIVIPGFVARTPSNRTCLLGRGGSDLTAIFLAATLQAERCCLVKDVHGLFNADPAVTPNARKFESVSYEDALTLDDSIIQHKAVRFAQHHNVEFQVGGLLHESPTHVGNVETSFAESKQSIRPFEVVVLGHGTVGSGVTETIQRLSHVANVKTIVTSQTSPTILEEEFDEGFDVIIEATGDVNVYKHLRKALELGRTVISANKALIAEFGNELRNVAEQHGGKLYCSASVGGCLPILEFINKHKDDVQSCNAILNGTTNYVIDKVTQGNSLNETIQHAQEGGLCEIDPWRDLGGQDALDKLIVIHQQLDAPSPLVQSLPKREDSEQTIANASRSSEQLRQVASIDFEKQEHEASVSFKELPESDPLSKARSEENIAEIQFIDGSTRIIRGRGAGKKPTSTSIIGDLIYEFQTNARQKGKVSA